jgi:hypothetical protein
VAAVSVSPGRSLFGKARGALTALRPARPRRPAVLAAVMAKAREHVVTAAALGAFDLGAFQVHIPHLGAAPGWAALGISLLLLDFAVRG